VPTNQNSPGLATLHSSAAVPGQLHLVVEPHGEGFFSLSKPDELHSKSPRDNPVETAGLETLSCGEQVGPKVFASLDSVLGADSGDCLPTKIAGRSSRTTKRPSIMNTQGPFVYRRMAQIKQRKALLASRFDRLTRSRGVRARTKASWLR
jgi:hypothetical protein